MHFAKQLTLIQAAIARMHPPIDNSARFAYVIPAGPFYASDW
jgi:hypothetical protein